MGWHRSAIEGRRWAGAVALALAAVVTGCGGGGIGAGGDDPPGGGLRMTLGHQPDPPRAGEPVVWTLRVRNDGAEGVTLTFTSGQNGDVALTRDGVEAYRWSAGRFFVEAVRKVVLRPDEERSYPLEDEALSVAPGRYDVVATLAAEPAPEPVRQRVDVVE